MNTEEMLTTAIQKFLEQGRKSYQNNVCLYRSKFGCCPVGHLIKDEHYDETLETHSPSEDRVRHALKMSIGRDLTENEICFLEELQDCHDQTTDNPSEFIGEFKRNIMYSDVMPDYCKKVIC